MEVGGRPVELAEEAVEVGARRLTILHPRAADELIDEEAFEREEFLPYWAELWPSAVELARSVAARDLAGKPVVELGCGLALPAIAAALGGARALATDWSPDALRFARVNAERNGADLETALVSWDEPGVLLRRAPFELALAADVLYERQNADLLLALLPGLAPEVLLADPGRPGLAGFLERAAGDWSIGGRGPVYRLVRHRRPARAR
jgi:predicted nicotinamide N-methyase